MDKEIGGELYHNVSEDGLTATNDNGGRFSIRESQLIMKAVQIWGPGGLTQEMLSLVHHEGRTAREAVEMVLWCSWKVEEVAQNRNVNDVDMYDTFAKMWKVWDRRFEVC